MATTLPEDRAIPTSSPVEQLLYRRTRLPQRRFAVAGLIMIIAVVYLIVSSFSSAVAAVVSPGQLLQRGPSAYGQSVRLQGRVIGAVHQNNVTLIHVFRVSDGRTSIPVAYSSDLPSGFKAGASVEAQGAYNGHLFTAQSLTAKCPTKYQAAPTKG